MKKLHELLEEAMAQDLRIKYTGAWVGRDEEGNICYCPLAAMAKVLSPSMDDEKLAKMEIGPQGRYIMSVFVSNGSNPWAYNLPHLNCVEHDARLMPPASQVVHYFDEHNFNDQMLLDFLKERDW